MAWPSTRSPWTPATRPTFRPTASGCRRGAGVSNASPTLMRSSAWCDDYRRGAKAPWRDWRPGAGAGDHIVVRSTLPADEIRRTFRKDRYSGSADIQLKLDLLFVSVVRATPPKVHVVNYALEGDRTGGRVSIAISIWRLHDWAFRRYARAAATLCGGSSMFKQWRSPASLRRRLPTSCHSCPRGLLPSALSRHHAFSSPPRKCFRHRPSAR